MKDYSEHTEINSSESSNKLQLTAAIRLSECPK